jgi:hypothetical protein
MMSWRSPSNHVLPFLGFQGYRTEPRRAKNLISNMKNAYDGILGRTLASSGRYGADYLARLDAFVDGQVAANINRSVDVVLLEGFAGSGKSAPIKEVLQRIHSPAVSYRVSVPSTQLRAEWKEDLQLSEHDSWRIGTWESSLLKTSTVLVIDELYKLPRGYLDLCLSLDPAVTTVILLGDPCQGEYHSTNPHSTNARLSSESSYLTPLANFYQFWSYRIPQNIAALLTVPSFSQVTGIRGFRALPTSRAPLIVASTGAALVQSDLGYGAVTASASQGLTFRAFSQLLLDRPFMNRISLGTALVAVTRSRQGLVFTGDLHAARTIPIANPIIRAVVNNTPVDVAALMQNELTGRNLIRAPMTLAERQAQIQMRGGSTATLAFGSCSRRFVPAAFRTQAPLSIIPQRRPDSRLRPRRSRRRDPTCMDDLILPPSAILRGIHEDHANQDLDTGFIPETRRPLHHHIPRISFPPEPISSPDPIKAPCEPIYPGIDWEGVFNQGVPSFDVADKEINYKGTQSKQFFVLNEPYEFGVMPPKACAAQHHSGRDPTLLPASVVKRLRFRDDYTPVPLTTSDIAAGSLLFEAHCRSFHLDPSFIRPFDPILFAECISLNEYNSLTTKTKSVIQANAFRSDPDWRHTVVRIFAKTQQKVNEGSIFGNWKACQTLALMHDAVLLIFGPVVKYMNTVDKEYCPPNIFKYGGKTPHDLSDHAAAWLKPGRKRCMNDYTGFDTNQGREAQFLEEKRQGQYSIPSFLTEWYVTLKTNLECQFGPLTSMRFTGEPGTYDFNSDFNRCVIYLRHDVPDNVPVYISGDDSAIGEVLPIRAQWYQIEHLFYKLQFKLEEDYYALFCGYYLSNVGAVRSPRTLLYKLMIAHADGSIHDKIASYLTEFNVGHSLGQDLWNALPVDQVFDQSAVFDYFCRRARPAQKIALRIGRLSQDEIDALLVRYPTSSFSLFHLLSEKVRSSLASLGRASRISL